MQKPYIGAMTGDEIRHFSAAGKPPAWNPPVRVNHLGEELSNGSPDRRAKADEESRKGERGERRQQSSLMQVAGIGHSLQEFRSITKAT
jgi:hypothetical protein